ncbi:hormone-sensitive lipase-like [Glandiceps talaboti]
MAATENNTEQTATKNTTDSIAAEFKTLRSLCIDNIEYFQRSKSQYKNRYFTAFCVIMQTADAMEPLMEGFQRIVHHFDFDEETPGNGYRSLLSVVRKCIKKIVENSKYIKDYRSGLMFRGGTYCTEIENYSNVFGQLKLLLGQAQRLLGGSKPGELFPDENLFPLMDGLLVEAEALYRECFYGRALGFQYHESMQQSLSVISVAMASFSEGFNKHEGGWARFASSLVNSGKYMMDPILRAEQIVKVTRNADIKFCKAFWSISEGDVMQAIPNFMCPALQVNRLIQIQPHCFEISTADGQDTRTITPPCAHTGPGPAFIRLMSAEQREGALMSEQVPGQGQTQTPPPAPTRKVAPLSRGLVIHIHGGGFVAQSSKSHEVYLRVWAKEMGVPIVSIDYSHAPEQPFPRAFEECFFAYAWIIRNAPALGSSGKHICLVGDSAGGNLAIAVAMRAANYGIRVPDGIVTCYAPFQVRYSPSPSRILSLMDPLLPLGVLSCCLASYAGMKEEMVDMPAPAFVIQSQAPPDSGEQTSPPTDGLTSNLSQDSGTVDSGSSAPASPPAVTDDSGAETNGETNSTQDDQPKSNNGLVTQDDSSVVNGVEMEEISLTDDSPGAAPAMTAETGESQEGSKKGNKPQPLYFNSPSQLYDNTSVGSQYVSSPIKKYRNIPIVNNPYLSPLVAEDELLKDLPPVHIVACHLDPILDDSVMFARLLKKVGVPVKVKIVEDLPHGFLNFSVVSKGAKAAMEDCIKIVMESMYGEGYEDWEQLEVGCQTDTTELQGMPRVERTRPASQSEDITTTEGEATTQSTSTREAQQPVTSQTAQQPVTSQTAQQPVTSETTQQPVTPQTAQQPVASEQPVTSQSTQEEMTTQGTQQQVTSETTQQEVTSSQEKESSQADNTGDSSIQTAADIHAQDVEVEESKAVEPNNEPEQSEVKVKATPEGDDDTQKEDQAIGENVQSEEAKSNITIEISPPDVEEEKEEADEPKTEDAAEGTSDCQGNKDEDTPEEEKPESEQTEVLKDEHNVSKSENTEEGGEGNESNEDSAYL